MFRVYLILITLFAACVSVSAQSNQIKIGILNSEAFADEKNGITRFVAAIRKVNQEFAGTKADLDAMRKRLTDLSQEVSAGKPLDEKTYKIRIDEAQNIERNLKFRQEEAKIAYDKLYQAEVSPVMFDIGKALTEFARQKGFAVVFDIAKDEVGLLVAIGDEKVDVTKEFIAYYNTRPSSPVNPK